MTFLFLLFMALLPLGVAGQEQKQRCLHLGPGWSYNTTRDAALSPLQYKGHGISLALGYEAVNSGRITEVSLIAQYGRIRSSASALSSAMLLTRADITYRELYYLGKLLNDHYTAYLGGGFLTQAVYREHNRFSNNAYQYDYANSLSVETRIQRTFPLKQRSLDLGWGLSLPFISMMVRPGYNSSLPEGFVYYPNRPAKAVLASAELGMFVSYLRTLSTVDLCYHLLNGNALRLRYSWDIYRFTTANTITSATHSLHFQLLFNLSRPS